MNKSSLDHAIVHLSKDIKLNSLIKKYHIPQLNISNNPFKSLIKYIIYQQLSIAAAKAIYTRFLDLLNNNPLPKDVLDIANETFQNIGLSKQKINYIYEISKYFLSNRINFKNLDNVDIYKHLIQIKGVGPWTIDMFLMFTLCRLDILPLGDLGIKKGFKILYKLDRLPTDQFMLQKSIKWIPYRSIASMYLWKVVDGDTTF